MAYPFKDKNCLWFISSPKYVLNDLTFWGKYPTTWNFKKKSRDLRYARQNDYIIGTVEIAG